MDWYFAHCVHDCIIQKNWRNSRIDLVLAAPVAAVQKVMVDVTIETAIGDWE